jgi:peptidoglycan/LPS O-acetylase OafA/YrhL
MTLPSPPAPVPRAADAGNAGRTRSDIQGLRALAVGLVVLDHFVGWPRGGFVGVDVFFVLSGFLITGLLVREMDRSGRLSLAAFYARRIRRIVPAALLVVAVTVGCGYAVWFRPEANQTLLDGIASALWVPNWHFAAVGTDYLAGQGVAPALQHYWSLGVEEQFYVLWPWVLLGAAWLGRRWRGPRQAMTAVVVVLALLSFVWSVAVTTLWPRIAYFDTISRTWELALGGLLALTASRWSGLHQWRRWAGIVGVAIILVSALVITPASPFPGPWAALPVLGALVALMGREDGFAGILLTNRVSRWIGDTSFSLYLWHFPVLVFMRTWQDPLSAGQRVAGILVSVLLASASYLLVENPIRRGRWLRSWERTPPTWRRNALTGVAVASVLLALVAVQLNPTKVGVISGPTFPITRAATTETFATQAAVTAGVRDGLARTGWDGLTPSPNALSQTQLPFTMDGGSGCSNPVGSVPVTHCVDGPGSRTAILLGDSVALTWYPTVRGALDPTWRIMAVGVPACAPWDVRHGSQIPSADFPGACAASRRAIRDLVAQVRPDAVFVSSASTALELVDAPDHAAAWERGAQRTVTDLLTLTDRVVVLGNPPRATDPRRCISRLHGPSACTFRLDALQTSKDGAEERAVAAAGAHARFVRASDWFCSDGRCPVIVGPYLTRTDHTHITAAFSGALAPVLAAQLRQDGLPGIR